MAAKMMDYMVAMVVRSMEALMIGLRMDYKMEAMM